MAESTDISKIATWMHRVREPGVTANSGITAQEVYASLIKEQISPALRDMGLVGSGGRYSLKSESHWALVGFQKSAFSDKNEVRFTVNLVAVSKVDWEVLRASRPHLRERPEPTYMHPAPATSQRIGGLVDDGSDKWWRIIPAIDPQAVVDSVLADIRAAGVPWLRARVGETDQ